MRARLQRPRGRPALEEVLLALLVLALLAALATLVRDRADRLAAPPRVSLRPPAAGTRTLEEPLDLVMVIDDSSSTQESDPHRYRASEGRLVTTWFARHSGDERDRLAAARFTTEVVESVDLAPAAEAEEPLHALLGRARGETGTTDIVRGLAWAGEQCARSGPNRSVVVLFTDGAQDTRLSGGFDGVTEQLDRLGCDAVWLVALSGGGVYDSVADEWDAEPLAGRIRIDRVAPGTVARAIAEVVLVETGQEGDGDLVAVR